MLHPALQLIEENISNQNSKLDLGRCGLSKLPKELFDCVWIEELILSNEWWDFQNREWIKSANDISANHINSIPSAIGKLKKLTTLKIGGNPSYPWDVTDISSLKLLPSLKYLDASCNKISEISFLSSLENLEFLNLANNEILNASVLKSLTELTTLDLSCNNLSDISTLHYLPNLRILNLCNNKISDIHLDDVENFKLELNFEIVHRHEFQKNRAYLAGNEIKTIPPEVLHQGSKFIIQYLKSQNKVALNECKVIITGRGGVGKTSLQKRLFGDEKFDPIEVETHGIRKRTWEEGVKSYDSKNVKVHFWDMGGQQEQQTLHQLFYTENAIYILLLDRRTDEDPEYFLELIKVYGNNCPVIIVINSKINLRQKGKIKYDLAPEFDSTLRDKYANIRKIFGVCCGQDNDIGIAELRKYLIDFIPSLDHVREKYPAEWLEIKDELISKIDKNYIKFEEYEQLCRIKNVYIEELQVGLAKMLNNTGTVTYFDKPYLHYYILNPDWVTTGTYQIILSPLTAKNRGRITFKDLKSIFLEKLIFQYNERDYEFLMKLMFAYSLCHEFKEGQEWLIPSSLKGQPITNLVNYKKGQEYRLYCLKYRTSLPQSIVHKFIARNINYAYKHDYWRNGIVLKHKDSETFLFTEADYKEKEIRVWIKGKEILEAWKFFRKDFIDLSAKFDYDEMVEVEGHQNAMMSYKELINLYKNLPENQLGHWYNPHLNIYVNILKTLVLFDDVVFLQNELEQKNEELTDLKSIELKLDSEKKRLQIERNALDREKENIQNLLVKKWKSKSLNILIVSFSMTLLFVIIYINEFPFVMSPERWVNFKNSELAKWIGLAVAFVWNSFIGKIVYDRFFDYSKEKAFREKYNFR